MKEFAWKIAMEMAMEKSVVESLAEYAFSLRLRESVFNNVSGICYNLLSFQGLLKKFLSIIGIYKL